MVSLFDNPTYDTADDEPHDVSEPNLTALPCQPTSAPKEGGRVNETAIHVGSYIPLNGKLETEETKTVSTPLKVLTTCEEVDIMGRKWEFKPELGEDQAARPRILFVCVHGFGASSYSFEQIGPSLRTLGEVVAFDRCD
eukprot:7579659-Pyramimonas_sp.AAC.1